MKRKAGQNEVFDALTSVTTGMGNLPLSLFGKGRYKETPQVKGRIARAFAKETHGGKGKDALRSGYKMHMKKGYKQTSAQERAKIVRALAKNTVKGKGLIAKRPAYRKYVK